MAHLVVDRLRLAAVYGYRRQVFRQVKARHADLAVRHPVIQVEAARLAEIIAPVVAGWEDDIGNGRRTLRKLYATPWNPWTLVETLDKKTGQRVKKA